MRVLCRCLAVCGLLATGLHAAASSSAASARTRPLSSGGVALGIDRSGIYRITGATLRAHGFDWSGNRGSDLALVTQGKAVPRFVSTAGPLSDSSYVEFYASSIFTFYTSRNIYYLQLNHQLSLDAATVPASPEVGVSPATFLGRYLESRRTLYEPMAANDQWLFGSVTAITPPKHANVPTHLDAAISLPAAVPQGQASITFDARGAADLPGPQPQHHLMVYVNGHQVAEQKSSGFVEKVTTVKFSASWLLKGPNIVRFLLPGDVRNKTTDGQDVNIDIMEIRTFALRYPHAFVATDGSLAAQLTVKPRVVVGGLRTAQVSAWRVVAGTPQRLTGIAVHGAKGGFQAEFAATSTGDYRLEDATALLLPASFTHVHDTGYLLQGQGQLLVIGPQKFLPALSPLVTYHRIHGMTVKLVDLADVYTKYSAGLLDAAAIRSYIADAEKQLGTQSVLLVGADNYDYHHYITCRHSAHDKKHGYYIKNDCTGNPNDRVFLPSLYVDNIDFGRIPSDWAYVGTSPVGIGRIPAVNADQVRVAVAKSLLYLRSVGRTQAIFTAGGEEPDFAQTSDALAGLLPSAYTVAKAYNKPTGARKVRLILRDGINRGAKIVDFVGHGNLEQWGMPPSLLNVGMVPKLQNRTKPAVFFGWGCQTAYDVDPTDQALNARLLFAQNGGAALALGSTGLDDADVQAVLAKDFFQKLFHDPAISTVGQALQAAKVETLAKDPSVQPPVDSYELYGDPALPVGPLRGTP
ncbi:MAG: C25 family cysteine peptidase [Chloroflexota bacterium]|nr:C25 family cysteine peptidase [Chloroflexota bacterium]